MEGEIVGRGVQSVEVGGRILSAMAQAGRPLMLRDIAAGAKVTPAQAHAYLVSFRKLGLVEQEPGSVRYQLGPFALQLGLARMRSSNTLRMAGGATVALAAELGLMVTVTVWGSFGPTIVQVQEAVDQLHVNIRAGAVYSLTGTATGRVFAAFLPAAVIQPRIAAERREGARSQRIGDAITPERFALEVAEVKRLGYATAAGSPIPGVNAVSAPVFDHTGQMQLAVTLIGPADAVDVARNGPHARRLLDVTAQLSSQLGHSGPSPAQSPVDGGAEAAVMRLVPKAAKDKGAAPRRGQKRRA